jgi:hypothetical protein
MIRRLMKDDASVIALAIIGGGTLAAFSTIINGSYGFIDGFWWVMLSVSFTTILLSILHARKEAARVRVGAHYDVFALRICYFLLLSMLVFREFSWVMLLFAIHQGSLFGVIFDPLRNYYNHEDFFYSGAEAIYDRVTSLQPVLWFIVEIKIFLLTTLYLLYAL